MFLLVSDEQTTQHEATGSKPSSSRFLIATQTKRHLQLGKIIKIISLHELIANIAVFFPPLYWLANTFFYPRTRAYALSRNSEGMLWCLRLIAYYSFDEYMKGYTCREASYIPNLCRITHPHVDFSSVVGVILSRELGFSTQVIYPKVMEIAYYLDQCRAISIFTTRFICPPQRDSAETKLSYTNINKCKGTHHIWISPEAIRSLRIVQRL